MAPEREITLLVSAFGAGLTRLYPYYALTSDVRLEAGQIWRNSYRGLSSVGLEWYDEAWEDYLYWQSQDKKTLKRLNNLIKDTQRSPYEGIGKPEPKK